MLRSVLHFEVGDVFDYSIIQGEFVLLEELHDGCGDKRLGYRGHVKERSWRNVTKKVTISG